MRKSITVLLFNIRICFSYNILMSVIYIVFAAFFFQLKDMQYKELVKMGELYLPLNGIFLFVYIGGIESHTGTWEMVCCRKFKFLYIHMIRIVFLAGVNMLSIFTLLSYVWLNSNYLRFGEAFWGIYINSLFLGILGMMLVDLSNDYRVGYIVSLGYYLIATMYLSGVLNGYFQLTGYSNNQIESKYVLFALIVLMLLVDCIFYCKKQRIHFFWRNT